MKRVLFFLLIGVIALLGCKNKQVSFIDTDQGQNFEAKVIGKMKMSNDAILFSKYCVLPKWAILVISLIGVVVSILAVVGLLLEKR